MQDIQNRTRRYFTFLGLLGLITLCPLVSGLASRRPAVETATVKTTEANVAKETPDAPATQTKEPEIIRRICELIYKGDFDSAGDLIESVPFQYDTDLHRLSMVVYEYKAISQRREQLRKKAYGLQLEELDVLSKAPDVNDVNDANSASDITKALSIINKTKGFANQQQREALLAMPFVNEVFQKAIDKASEYESRGKWLDAYIMCYSWLQSIEPDKKEYSDYADLLVEKAGILGSMRDSPCESRQERHERIERVMFVRAIDALHFYYVRIIDYRQMAEKAVRRSQMLAEVIQYRQKDDSSSNDANDNSNESDGSEEDEPNSSELPIPTINLEGLPAWSASLAAILDGINESPTGISKDKFINIFDKVLALNEATVQLPRTLLIAQFSEAALSVLDPYTVMVWPRQAPDFDKTMTNEFTGIGIEISKQKGMLTVASLLPDTPAYKSGLDAGDVIENVDDVPTKDMSLNCAVRRITGPAGTKVVLTIRSPGEKDTKKIIITRARITVPTIRGWQRTEGGKWLYMLDDDQKIGYIRLTSFSGSTSSDFESILKKLEARGLKGLILDLRLNTGGLLDSAVDISDKFIRNGLIVSTQPRYIPTYTSAKSKGTHPDYPLVILVNRFSASASEIVSGALQDKKYNRAIIVGERTHGKGSVQGITPYPGQGAQLKYTMAYYHLPSGQRVKSQDEVKKQGKDDWGIGPDIEVKLRSDELRKMLDVQRDNDVLVAAGHDNGQKPVKKHSMEETLAADPQLGVALLVAKTKLIQQEAGKH